MNKNPGQKHLQDMMAQSQKQMADYQKRGMQHEWMKKQEEDKHPREEVTSQEGKGGEPGGGYFQADERFKQVEAEVARLKDQLAAGRLSEEEFNEQLKNLMVEDDNGDWWMVGASTGGWYRFDGQSWVQSNPPGSWVQGGGSPIPSTKSSKVISHPKGHPFGACMLFVFLVVLVIAAGFAAGAFAANVLGMQGDKPFIPAGIVWGAGLYFAIKRALRTWRGY
jgi:hypothetical protein